MRRQYTIASFSGGKDSTAMVLHMIDLGEHIDEVITCDTGMEFPAMYDHIAKVREVIEAHGIKFTALRDKYTFEEHMCDVVVPSKNLGLDRNFIIILTNICN